MISACLVCLTCLGELTMLSRANRFGTVYMATDRKTGEKYSVKSIT